MPVRAAGLHPLLRPGLLQLPALRRPQLQFDHLPFLLLRPFTWATLEAWPS